MADGYTRSLQRGYDSGEVQGYERDELEVLAYMVIGAREFLLERYAVQDGAIHDLPDEVKRTYLKAVARSLGIDPARMDPDAEGQPAGAQTTG